MNKTLKYIISALLVVTAFTLFTVSCSTDETLGIELQSPYGKWTFEGFTTSDAKTRIKAGELTKSITLTLNSDGTFSGNTSANSMSGKYKLDTARRTISFPKEDMIMTEVMETDEGNRYLNILQRVNSYKVYTDKLYLITDSEQLKFGKIVNPSK